MKKENKRKSMSSSKVIKGMGARAFASVCAPSAASRNAYARERCRTIVLVALKFSAAQLRWFS